jgi:2,3-bisphosphoglycerate-independent phosphoglycerate mutase
VPVAIGGPGLLAGVRFRTDLQTPEMANVAATIMNLHGFEALMTMSQHLLKLLTTEKFSFSL